MPEETSSASSSEKLIEAYNEATNRRKTARRTVTLALICIVFMFGMMIWNEINFFREHGIPRFSATLSAEATEYMPVVSERVAEMTDIVVNKYIEAFSNVYANEQDRYIQTLSDEFVALDQYAKNSWPLIEEQIAELVIAQENATREALRGVLTEEDIGDVSMAYRLSMENYLTVLFETEFADQIKVGDQILANLTAIAETEPDAEITDSQYILGMLMELLGLEMQDNSLYLPESL